MLACRDSKALPTLIGVALGLLLWVPISALAEEGQPDPSDMSLEELLNLELTIASKKGTTAREAPGIVTLVTGEEIANSGARDLIDVLRLVPGFDFAIDVQGVIGIASRGNWGHEGKILLLVDGQEINEPLYSTLQFGNRFPVSQISKIEIIRGPGSAIYGGYAELAVINIITKSAAELDGAQVTLTDGEMSDKFARRRLDLSYGKASGASSISMHGSWANGNRSDATYTDLSGNSYSMADNSKLGDAYFNLAGAYKNYKARLIVDQYHTTERDEFGENLPKAVSLDFNSIFFEATAVYDLGHSLSLTPRVNYKSQQPWRENSPSFYYDKTVDRLLGNVTLNWDPRPEVSVLGGVEYFNDHATTASGTDPADYFPNGGRSINYDDVALFAQGLFVTGAGNLTLGARWEHHSESGSSFVPRIGLTKILGRFHYKLLASRAFRAPAIENIRLGNGTIKPEETTVYEVEAGYQFRDDMFVTANVFDTKIDKPIVYFFDAATDTEGYQNFDQTGTRGVEIEGRYRPKWGYLNLSYSWYEANDNRVDSYSVPGHDNVLLAFPQSKVALNANFKLGAHARLNPTLVYYGKRYGYGSADADGNAQIQAFDSETLASLYLMFPDLWTKGLTLGVGVFDMFGENHVFIQPYNNYHAPYPDATREYVFRLSYRQ